MPSRALIRVPASTSNLGPGFDCLGLALELYNTTHIARREGGPPPQGMVDETAVAFFKHVAGGELRPFDFKVSIEGAVPISRGLGSSVTVRLGVLMGLAELVREEVLVTRDEILQLLVRMEGHPDNAVASMLGGFAVCAPTGPDAQTGFGYTRVPVKAELSFIALIPELRLSTETARGLLPREVSFRSAVENSQRTARITALFCTGDYASLRGLFVDHLHQPYRQVLIPGFQEILEAAREAGALGSFLSGAGSTLMALTLDRVEEISRAMLETAQKHNLAARTLVLRADNEGAQVVSSS